ncbi:MAG: FtsW/RodA/SpoVE family cell cycle protein [Oscillospiraceae bacterium]|nr:FtsW/RodA/SpoVE family cell cycle protein [Oscillospiraceae bacterium]
MLSEKYDPEVWGYFLYPDGSSAPLNHWECLIGRTRSSDIVVNDRNVSRIHAAMIRNDKGVWRIFDIASKKGVFVNRERVTINGLEVRHGDRIQIGNTKLAFIEANESDLEYVDERRTSAGAFISPTATLLLLSLFQAFMMLQYSFSAKDEYVILTALSFFAVMILQWICYLIMRTFGRTGFEVETLAFFLSTLGLSIVATSVPSDLDKTVLLLIAGVILYFVLGWWLHDLRRVKAMRWAATIAAIGLLALNLVLSEAIYGAKNWIEIGGITVQPSELVKVLYIYAGAASLERLFARRNLILFIGFSAVCVMALALMGDYGTAMIFFGTFLVIAFMRSGSLATVFLALGGAGMAGFLVFTIKPYIAQRFSTWGNVWADPFGAGYQQTRTLAAAASGGLFGHGAGKGWLQSIVFSNTDMVFGIICEELGLIIAILAVLTIISLAFFAVRSAAHGRSTYYVIAACSAASLMIIQMSLNVFGSLDILPFTGVTFPFISKGGTSLLSCWMMLAFIKAADTRKDASFVVKKAKVKRNRRTAE